MASGDFDQWQRGRDHDLAVSKIRSDLDLWTPPVWARLLAALSVLVLGFALLAGAITLGKWWFFSETETVSTVTCDDDLDYQEESGITVEAFTGENGVPCWRTTEEETVAITHGWPVGIEFSVNLLMFLVWFALAAVGLGVGLGGVIYVFTYQATEDWRALVIEVRIRNLEEGYRKKAEQAVSDAP